MREDRFVTGPDLAEQTGSLDTSSQPVVQNLQQGPSLRKSKFPWPGLETKRTREARNGQASLDGRCLWRRTSHGRWLRATGSPCHEPRNRWMGQPTAEGRQRELPAGSLHVLCPHMKDATEGGRCQGTVIVSVADGRRSRDSHRRCHGLSGPSRYEGCLDGSSPPRYRERRRRS